MFKAINGWTKAKILKVIRARRYKCAAENKNGNCSYLTKNGNRCAVGLFIPKGHKGAYVGGNVVTLLGQYPDLIDKLPLSQDNLMKLQRAHDACAKDGESENKNAKQVMLNWVKANVK